ncbi:MAG TPA: SRPBCC family protein [Candidatus Nitrosotalea sp.]|nr:SRPBCC family protein [Nitrososphaerota archaeon]HKU33881.1 SRPBCC family protein [Candidatus Nitrosotalea sp.]
MNKITAKIQINAPHEKVWKIISEIDNDPTYWRGITSIKNTSKEQNIITRNVFLGKDNKCQQRVTLFPKDGIHIKLLKGPIAGVKDIIVHPFGNTTILEVEMSYTLSGVVGLFSRNAAKYLQRESELALQLIKEEAEGDQQKPFLEERRLWADLIHDKDNRNILFKH